MASKESTKSKSKFPRRILSSLRRHRKSNLSSLSYKNDFGDASINAGDFDTARNETLIINLEATLPLESPKKDTNKERESPKKDTNKERESPKKDTNKESEVSETCPLVEPEPQSFHPINSDVSILENVSREFVHRDCLSPNSRLVELGGGMSASTDSGIDCGVLVSEKNSPEQFVAFTRREAERLRHEQQIAEFNVSVLEPVNEVDSHSSSDIENDLRNTTISADTVSNNPDTGVDVGNTSQRLNIDLEDRTNNESNEERAPPPSSCSGDYVTLSSENDVRLDKSDDQTDYVTLLTSTIPSDLSEIDSTFVGFDGVNTTALASLVTVTVSSSHESVQFVSGDYVNHCANKTDDSKSVEAGLPARTHNMVNPTPIISTSIATQRTLASTPSPANIYINENSAFAKCKSIKRCVSDTGKGFFRRFRHRSKDNLSNGPTEGDLENKESNTRTNSSIRREKKLKKTVKITKKKKAISENEISESSSQLKSPVHKEVLSCSVSSTITSVVSIQDRKSPVTKGKSPVTKEVLCESDRQKLTDNLSSSPVQMESLQDFTNSICKMTSALQASSVESIECICDCKNRNIGPECCEKRKTPPSATSGVAGNSLETVFDEFTPNQFTCNQTFELHAGSSSDDSCCDLPNQTVNLSSQKSFCNLCDESNSESDPDDDENGPINEDTMEDNLDCSNLCIASPETGKYRLSDEESSDTETGSLNSFLSSGSSTETSDGSQCFQLDVDASAHSLNAFIDDGVERKEITERKVWNGNPEIASSQSSNSIRSGQSTPKTFGKNLEKANENGGEQFEQELGACGYDFNEFQSEVSFREVDFDAGEVMYIDNSICEDFDKLMDTPEMSSRPIFTHKSFLPRFPEAPVPSPCTSKVKKQESPLKYPINKSWGGISMSEFVKSCGRSYDYNGCDYDDSVNTSCQDSNYTNVSFEGSFAEISYSLNNGHHNRPKHKENLNQTVDLGSLRNQSKSQEQVLGRRRAGDGVNPVNKFSAPNRRPAPNRRSASNRHSAPVDRLSMSFSHPEEVYRPEHQANASFGGFRDDLSFYPRGDPRDDFRSHSSYFQRHPMRRSYSAAHGQFSSPNFSRNNRLYSSFHESSPCPSPLDLSMNKGRRTSPRDSVRNKSAKWLENHVGQVMSPAKRVLQKNRGVSESELCKEILNLYVNDVGEQTCDDSSLDRDTSLNASSMSNTSELEFSRDDNVGDNSVLKYGTYVAPRHMQRETNVDDFTTTTVLTCYSGEARTRRLQAANNSILLANERRGRQRADDSLNKSVFEDDTLDNSQDLLTTSPDHKSRRQALKDKTNTSRLSKLKLPHNVGHDVSSDDLEEDIEAHAKNYHPVTDHSFDRLTMLHTARNGQRKVRCLTMDESQSVIKSYPPPKEASRVSWGQTISEMDLYRHTPRKTPVKTRPILTQKENNYPFEEDTPSPIVLTKIRKPKAIAKKYKNWPWS